MTQVVARLDDDLVAAVDELVSQGLFESRSDAIRVALRKVVDERKRRLIGEAIIDGYRRIPETAEELTWAKAATIAMIEEEPW
jgi:Arc/MetJ-type ribon-helix-helix transcriptional regulator